MSDMRCTACGMVMEAGKSYGYACPTANRCSFIPAAPVVPATLPPMIGTGDAEYAARIAALEADLLATCQREAAMIVRHDAKVEKLEAEVARLGSVNASLANDVVQAGMARDAAEAEVARLRGLIHDLR